MRKTQKLEKEILKLKDNIRKLEVDQCRMEEKLNAITEYLDIDYGIRIYEKIGDEIRTDVIVIEKEENNDKISNFVGKFKRTFWNKE